LGRHPKKQGTTRIYVFTTKTSGSFSDSERDNFLLQNFGIKVLRYQNSEVLNGPVGVLKNLSAVINPLLAYPLSRKGK
jgi:hypothetical protein